MVDLWQSINRQHAERRRESGEKNGPLVGGNDEGWPRVVWTAGSVDRVCPDRNPGFQGEHSDYAEQAADEADQRDVVAMEADRYGRFFNQIRRVAIHAPVARVVSSLRGAHQIARSIKLGE